MCKFCKDNNNIETTLGDNKAFIFIDEEDRRMLNIRIEYLPGLATTRPIKINFCPFCGNDLGELNCEECANYNLGDGIDDISYCEDCKYK